MDKSRVKHIDGFLHATGKARFVGDLPAGKDVLFVYPVFSRIARGKIKSINFDKAKKIKGYVDSITLEDIPGENNVGVMEKGEPVFPEGSVEYCGQPVCAVIARDFVSAVRCAEAVEVEYVEEEPVLTIEQALVKGNIFNPVLRLSKGNIEKGFDKSEHILEGAVETPIQEHFYMETQHCYVEPSENGFTVYPASQSPSEIQEILSSVLRIPQNKITVDIKRLGGGFGGKEHAPTLFAAIATLASRKTAKPVLLSLMRDHDIMSTGKRHEFKAYFKAGFDSDGRINALEYHIYSNAGAYADLSIPVLERCILNAENAYNIENFSLSATACRTNLHPFTAFRGFGAPQGTFIMEYVIEEIANYLKKDSFSIRKVNLYKTGDRTPYGQILEDCQLEKIFEKAETYYSQWKKEVEDFNAQNRFKKRGIGVSPIKFGISFTTKALNRGYALVILYTDGTVSVSHGGVEMGQEVSTRVAQIVAQTLGITVDKIEVESANTKRIANLPPTAASTAVDLNGNAAYLSALELRKRLEKVASEMFFEKHGKKPSSVVFENNFCLMENEKIPFARVVETAVWNREKMAEYQFYKTPKITGFDEKKGKGNPFYYYVHGIAVSVVEVDLLTGELRLLKTKIIHETGKSINKDIDEGQVAGAFVQGAGWLTCEQMVYKDGVPLSISPSTYKIPTIADIPDEFDIELYESNSKFSSIFGTKGIGEPPFLYGHSVFLAVKNAIEGEKGERSFIFPPATPENVLKAVERLKNGKSL